MIDHIGPSEVSSSTIFTDELESLTYSPFIGILTIKKHIKAAKKDRKTKLHPKNDYYLQTIYLNKLLCLFIRNESQ